MSWGPIFSQGEKPPKIRKKSSQEKSSWELLGPPPTAKTEKIGKIKGTLVRKVPGNLRSRVAIRNPNLGLNAGKRILDARILDPNSWVKVFILFFPARKAPRKFHPQEIHLPKSTFQNSTQKAGKNIHVARLQGHLAGITGPSVPLTGLFSLLNCRSRAGGLELSRFLGVLKKKGSPARVNRMYHWAHNDYSQLSCFRALIRITATVIKKTGI